jgi:SAM-dependent methyltransferase
MKTTQSQSMTQNNWMLDIDAALATRYGSFASYTNDNDPIREYYGDNPAHEVDRLLHVHATPASCVLDIGCGAGFTLCRLAPKVAEIWGIDQDETLLDATRQRVAALHLNNARLVSGNVAVADDMQPLPDNAFDVVFSRRGPNVVPAMLRAIKPNAVIVQELVRGTLGLKALFGREPVLPNVGSDPHELIERYAWLGFVPVSIKDYFFDEFYRDDAHLITSLRGKLLWDWRMPDLPYDEMLDRAALDVYVRYNTTARGIRVTHRRSVYLFRRTTIARFPAIPDAQPLYPPH